MECKIFITEYNTHRCTPNRTNGIGKKFCFVVKRIFKHLYRIIVHAQLVSIWTEFYELVAGRVIGNNESN